MSLPYILSTPPTPPPLSMKGHRSIEGKAFRFKHRIDWPAAASSELSFCDPFFLHPVFVVRKLGHDRAEVVSLTSTRDDAVDPRNYLQIATPNWMKKQTGPKLNLVNTPGCVTQLPKTSWVRLDKCREVPLDILQGWMRDDGVQYMLRKESREKLYRFVRRAEAGWIDDREEDQLLTSEFSSPEFSTPQLSAPQLSTPQFSTSQFGSSQFSSPRSTLPRTPPRTPSPFPIYEMPADNFPEVGSRFPGWGGLNAVEGDPYLDRSRHCTRQGAPTPLPTPKERKALDVDELLKALRDLEGRVDQLHNALSLLQIVSQTGCRQNQRSEAWDIR
ncbi:hypothetical protein V496_03291 [Pseudogymnoascus sp. VKM F-4515 (FW-2607)]|nr:hypothetical protein V496_03291 [Pseudogymnoascus sp. VKM F-4515 (FW-2607)]KFZ00507.1 hypothetical protein V498_00032 [Pseudogymnoascus sp. VKM F-4517 (FW-2822)]